MVLDQICSQCRRGFVALSRAGRPRKYCSDECMLAANKTRILERHERKLPFERACEHCGRWFIVGVFGQRSGRWSRRFCSKNCVVVAGERRRGVRPMAEYREHRLSLPPATPCTKARALGLKVYFTGKPCKNGHLSERWVNNGCCVECKREQVARFLLKNPGYEKSKHQKRTERERDERARRLPHKCANPLCETLIPPLETRRKFCSRGCMHRTHYADMRYALMTLQQQEKIQ